MQLLTKQRRRTTINITSLIDVLFLLLIFLMVSSSFLEEPGMKLSLPEAQSAEVGEKKAFTLYITEAGDLFLNDEKVPQDSLETDLESVVPKLADETLTLKADANATHGMVVKAMDAAKLAGVKRLVVATKPTARKK